MPSDFRPRLRQAIDIPKTLRFNLYVFSPDLFADFDQIALDNKLLKAIAELPERKKRAQLSSMKLTSRLDFDLVPAAACIKSYETFFPYLGVSAELEASLQNTEEILEVTTGDSFSYDMPGYKMVQFATAFLARQLHGLILDPLSYKIFRHDDPLVDRLLSAGDDPPAIAPLWTVIQSRLSTGRFLTTSHGLCRFGLPEFYLDKCKAEQSEKLPLLLEKAAQRLFESVIIAAKSGADQFLFTAPLVIPDRAGEPLALPLRLERSLDGPVIEFDFHGRQVEKDALLARLVERL